MTLALLLTAVGGAWAEQVTIATNESQTSYKSGDVTITCTNAGDEDGAYIGWEGATMTISYSGGNNIESLVLTISYSQGGEVTANPGTCEVSGSTVTVTNINQSSVTIGATNVKQISQVVVNYGPASAATAVDIAWDKAKKTGTFTMPGDNVFVVPEYYPQAALTAEPTAINDVPATTDGAIVKAGTVANIGSTTTAQGTVMYYVSPTALDDAALLALAADKWTADVPTAESLAQGQAYVYYYVRGNDSDTDEENFNDGDILAANALTVTIAAEPTYAVTYAEGTQDADKWTVKAGTDGSFQSLPLKGVKAGTKVKLKYDGDRSMLKGVKAEKKGGAAGNAYLKWDNTKKELVATEIPAEVTTVANADADVTWEAGTYVVEGEVTINGKISLNGNVDLIIKDGAKLTVTNQIVGSDNGKNLSIYGQANQTGQLVVNYSGHAITNVTTLEVHSCQVKATSSGNSCGGFNFIQTFNVYGGSVDAENTAANGGYGISLASSGSMNIYGGDVKAVGKGNKYGITGSSTTVTVYGGKLWAGCAGKKAIDPSRVTLTKGAGFSGKIETSDDNSAWTEYTEAGTPETKYVRVGY